MVHCYRKNNLEDFLNYVSVGSVGYYSGINGGW